jgi:hypothetical protein
VRRRAARAFVASNIALRMRAVSTLTLVRSRSTAALREASVHSIASAGFVSSAHRADQNAPDASAVRTALERVFARPEFQPERHPLRDRIDRIVRAIIGWIRDFFGISGETADRIFAGLFRAFIALIVVALVVWLVRGTLRAVRRGSLSDGDSAPTPDARGARVAELRERARAAEERGEHALAMRLFFWALVVGLGERGGLEYRDAWTNRELLERGAPAPNVARVLKPLVPELDRKVFGGERADSGDVARLAHLCDEMLGARR